MLHAFLKRSYFNVKDPAVLGMLDPFYDLLLLSLHSRHQRVVVLAMKVSFSVDARVCVNY